MFEDAPFGTSPPLLLVPLHKLSTFLKFLKTLGKLNLLLRSFMYFPHKVTANSKLLP